MSELVAGRETLQTNFVADGVRPAFLRYMCSTARKAVEIHQPCVCAWRAGTVDLEPARLAVYTPIDESL